MGNPLSKLKVIEHDGIILQHFLCLKKIDICFYNNLWWNDASFISLALDSDQYALNDVPGCFSTILRISRQLNWNIQWGMCAHDIFNCAYLQWNWLFGSIDLKLSWLCFDWINIVQHFSELRVVFVFKLEAYLCENFMSLDREMS